MLAEYPFSLSQARAAIAIVLVLATGESASTVQAAPVMEFDFGRTVECRDVTEDELAAENIESPNGGILGSDEKIIEMRLRISARLLSGHLGDVQELRIEVSDCDGRMRVHDFQPTTRLESLFAGDIEWTKRTEKSKAVGASLGGESPLPIGEVIAHVTPSASGSLGERETVTETQKRIAPKQLVIASGTIGQAHGVFFKLRASPQSTLEGVHELAVRFVVPRNWRGDAVRVSCQATGQQKILWMKQHKVWAHSIAPVALYLAGDAKARRAAEQYVKQ